MSVTRSLTFLWTPWTAALSIAAVLVAAVYSFIAWRRAGYRLSMGLLELLRLAIVAMVAVLLNQPEWIEEFRPEEKPTIAVLIDASPSMETRDVVGADQRTSSATTRNQAVAPMADPASWDKLRQRMNVVIQPFSSPAPSGVAAGTGTVKADGVIASASAGTPGGRGTDLFEPLARAPSGSPTCGGWCWPPTATGTRARRRCRPPPGCGSRACRCSPCRWAAGPGCPTSSS